MFEGWVHWKMGRGKEAITVVVEVVEATVKQISWEGA